MVAIHNTVNERAWRELLAWEDMHHRRACVLHLRQLRCCFMPLTRGAGRSACAQPRLVRFVGRPQDYSPKARLLNLLGYKLPFDRHDWVVDRCGRQARRGRHARVAARCTH